MNMEEQINSNCVREKLFSCNICHQQYKTKPNLTSHKNRVHEKVTPRNFHCVFCKKDFITYQHLEHHTRSHVREKPYSCNVCASSFAQKGSLQRHMQSIHSNAKSSVPCKIGKRVFHTRGNIVDHLSDHTGERPYKCHICGTTFSKNISLKTHLLIHGKIRKGKLFKCYLCDKMFARKDNMTEHMHTHLNEKPHKCGFCGKRFVRLSAMRNHWTVHNVGNHICIFCSKRFHNYSRLEGHVFSHTKEKPNFYQFCDQGWSQNGNLLAHLKKLHIS